MQLSASYTGDQTAPLHEVAAFINTQTPPDALVETYESELLFALRRRYHYPPDQVNGILLQRGAFGKDIPLTYDPLAADPDYLIVSYYVSGTGLYEPAIAAGHFRLIKTVGWYEVYERVR